MDSLTRADLEGQRGSVYFGQGAVRGDLWPGVLFGEDAVRVAKDSGRDFYVPLRAVLGVTLDPVKEEPQADDISLQPRLTPDNDLWVLPTAAPIHEATNCF